MTLTTGQTSFIFNIQSYIFVALCTSFSGYKEKLSLDINTLAKIKALLIFASFARN
jgi:hypothetical protein